jgi:hypothetical protein
MLLYVNSSYVWYMAHIFKFQNEVELETACGSLGLEVLLCFVVGDMYIVKQYVGVSS